MEQHPKRLTTKANSLNVQSPAAPITTAAFGYRQTKWATLQSVRSNP